MFTKWLTDDAAVAALALLCVHADCRLKWSTSVVGEKSINSTPFFLSSFSSHDNWEMHKPCTIENFTFACIHIA